MTNQNFIRPSQIWEVVMLWVLPAIVAVVLVTCIYFQVFRYHPDNFNKYTTRVTLEADK